MIIAQSKRRHDRGAVRVAARDRSALQGDHVGLRAPPARLRARGETHRAGIPGRGRLSRRDRQAHQRDPQRGRADGGRARLLDARSACSTTATTARPKPRRTCSGRSGASIRRRRPTAARSCARRRRVRRCSSMPGSRTRAGKPIEGAVVDVWQSSTEGYYENQDPVQADMNLRGKFTTDKDGHIDFRSIKPVRLSDPGRRPGRRSCCASRAGTTCGRRICMYWPRRPASRRSSRRSTCRTIPISRPTRSSASPAI